MKTVVLERDVHELEIKPHALLNEYRTLLERDVRDRLLDPAALQASRCPGCQSTASRPAFQKLGLAYVECLSCASVFVSPRPSEAALVAFFRDAPSSRFWRGRIGVETRDSRREKIFRPRARWVLDVLDRHRPEATLAIVAGYHSELLVAELLRQARQPLELVVTNPAADVEFHDVRLPHVEVRPTRASDLALLGPADLFLAFDLLDRAADVDAVFAGARHVLPGGGVLVASTTLITGFDLQILWDRSESIYPPERLNLLSAEGLTALAERHGFEVLEFSTPGVFDVEIVQRALEAHPDLPVPRFVKYVIERRDAAALDALQEYVQQHRLSSFARVALRKAQ